MTSRYEGMTEAEIIAQERALNKQIDAIILQHGGTLDIECPRCGRYYQKGHRGAHGCDPSSRSQRR